MFSICQPFSTPANLAEFTTGILRTSPPDTGLQPILQTHHRLHHVVHLIIHGHFSILANRLVEISVTIEFTGKLMGISLIKLLFEVVIPRQCFITIQSISPTNPNILETGIRSQLHSNLIEIRFSALSCIGIIRFIEWSH